MQEDQQNSGRPLQTEMTMASNGHTWDETEHVVETQEVKEFGYLADYDPFGNHQIEKVMIQVVHQ